MRRFLVLALLLVASSFGTRAAYACSCVPRPDLREAVQRSEVAFAGEITQSIGGGVYAVRVDDVLKGEVGLAERIRAESSQRSSCGIELTPGPILYTGDRSLHVHLCSAFWAGDEVGPALAVAGLTPSPPSAALEPIGPVPPEREVPTWPTWLLAGALALGIVSLGAAVITRRRAARSNY